MPHHERRAGRLRHEPQRGPAGSPEGLAALRVHPGHHRVARDGPHRRSGRSRGTAARGAVVDGVPDARTGRSDPGASLSQGAEEPTRSRHAQANPVTFADHRSHGIAPGRDHPGRVHWLPAVNAAGVQLPCCRLASVADQVAHGLRRDATDCRILPSALRESFNDLSYFDRLMRLLICGFSVRFRGGSPTPTCRFLTAGC